LVVAAAHWAGGLVEQDGRRCAADGGSEAVGCGDRKEEARPRCSGPRPRRSQHRALRSGAHRGPADLAVPRSGAAASPEGRGRRAPLQRVLAVDGRALSVGGSHPARFPRRYLPIGGQQALGVAHSRPRARLRGSSGPPGWSLREDALSVWSDPLVFDAE
jgi:hypothetical protein